MSVEKLNGHIFAIHAADNDGCDNRHAAPGQGSADWDEVIQALKKHRFSGYIAVDVGMVPDVRDQYIDSLRFLNDLSAKNAF